jgi:hypothetical protein
VTIALDTVLAEIGRERGRERERNSGGRERDAKSEKPIERDGEGVVTRWNSKSSA